MEIRGLVRRAGLSRRTGDAYADALPEESTAGCGPALGREKSRRQRYKGRRFHLCGNPGMSPVLLLRLAFNERKIQRVIYGVKICKCIFTFFPSVITLVAVRRLIYGLRL